MPSAARTDRANKYSPSVCSFPCFAIGQDRWRSVAHRWGKAVLGYLQRCADQPRAGGRGTLDTAPTKPDSRRESVGKTVFLCANSAYSASPRWNSAQNEFTAETPSTQRRRRVFFRQTLTGCNQLVDPERCKSYQIWQRSLSARTIASPDLH